MRLTLRIALVLVLAFSVVILFAAAKGDAKKGQELFTSKTCKMCHGEKGVGNPAMAKMMGVPMPALSSKEVQSLSDEQLSKVINEGKGKMKPVKMSEAEVADIVAYMRTLAQPAK